MESCTSLRPIRFNDVPRPESMLCRGTKVETRNNVICMVTRPGAGLSEVQIPACPEDLHLQNVQTSSGAYPASYSVGTDDSSQGDRSPTSVAEIKRVVIYRHTVPPVPNMPSWRFTDDSAM